MNEQKKAQAMAKVMKQNGIENLKYTAMCDDPFCKVCKKLKTEKAPWNNA